MRSVIARSSRISSGRKSRVPLGMRSTIARDCVSYGAPGFPSHGDGNVVLALDPGAEVAQALIDALVSAIDVANVADLGHAVGGQRRDQHRHAGADVRGIDTLAVQAA